MTRPSPTTDRSPETESLDLREEQPLSTADLVEEPPAPADDLEDVGLLEDAETKALRQRWAEVQAQFVDDPRAAVRGADSLVAELVQALVTSFADHKSALEAQWSRDEQPDTEQLRQALRRYRSFFSRLLAT